MEYREFTPMPVLGDIVQCFWSLRAVATRDAPAPERILPDGCCEIIINRAAPFEDVSTDAHGTHHPAILAAAQMTRCLRVRSTGEVDLVGIRFTPVGLRSLLGESMDRLVDCRLELDSLDRGLSRALHDATASRKMMLPRLQGVLAARRRPAPRDVDGAAALIRSRAGRIRVDRVAEHYGLSERQLERRFLREVGLTPKRFARIARFDALIRGSRAGRWRNWAALAQAYGYHDQAHLNRDFREFAGQSPSEYAQSEHLFSDFFTAGDVSDSYKTGTSVVN